MNVEYTLIKSFHKKSLFQFPGKILEWEKAISHRDDLFANFTELCSCCNRYSTDLWNLARRNASLAR